MQVSWKKRIIAKYSWELEEYQVLKAFTISHIESTAGARAEDTLVARLGKGRPTVDHKRSRRDEAVLKAVSKS